MVQSVSGVAARTVRRRRREGILPRIVGWFLGLLAVLVLTNCSNGPGTGPSAPRTAPVWPLTGEPVPSGAQPGPVLAVKVDNTGAGAPQVGVSEADVVVEELVEGGLTRLAVLFQSRMPERIGPVRSIRTSDLGIVAPTQGVLVASGGAQTVVAALKRAGLALVIEGDPGFSRDPSRSAPYNVMVDPAALVRGLPKSSATSQAAASPYLTRPSSPASSEPSAASAPKAADGQRASPAISTLELGFSPSTTVRWARTGEGWSRVDDRADPPFQPDVLIVVRAEVRDAGYVDPAGNPVPETVTEGTGNALIVDRHSATAVQWSKPSPESPWAFTRGTEAVSVPVGRVYIALVPSSGSVSTG